MIQFLGFALQHYADQLLAPFGTLASIAGSTALFGAFAGKAEALDQGMSLADADAHVQGCYNDGLVAGCALAFVPFSVLLAETLT